MRTIFGGMLLTGLLCSLSPTLAQDEKTPKRFSPKGGDWSAAFPGEVKTIKQSLMGIDLTMCAVETADGAYLVSINEMPFDVADLEADEIQTRLKAARDGAVTASKAKLISDRKIKLGNKHPGLELRATIKQPAEGLIRQRIYLVGNKMYQIMVLGKEEVADSDEATKFLNSLELKKK